MTLLGFHTIFTAKCHLKDPGLINFFKALIRVVEAVLIFIIKAQSINGHCFSALGISHRTTNSKHTVKKKSSISTFCWFFFLIS